MIERPYVHPVYQQGGVKYCSAFDYYTLGVILVEIASWRDIDAILSARTSSTSDQFLRDHVQTYVPQRMGTGFRDVIMACLDFYDAHAHESRKTDLLMDFQREVLERLQRASLPS